MRKSILMAVFICALALMTGCEGQIDFILGEGTEFLPEGGAAQYVIGRAMGQAVAALDWKTYAGKKVYLDARGGTPFTMGLAEEMAAGELQKSGAVVLTRLTPEQKESGQKEQPGDFELTVSVLTAGVHAYDGIVRRNIEGLALISLKEKTVNGLVLTKPGQLHRYRYEGLVLSQYFIVALLAFVLLLLILVITRLFRVRRRAASADARQGADTVGV